MHTDNGKIEEAIEYLDWYFYTDDGMADKTAVKFYEILKKEIEKKKNKK